MIPKIFGFPIWRGKIKSRVAKKYLHKWRFGWPLRKDWQREFSNLGIGDFINDCSGNNGRILEMTPFYSRCGRGQILLGVDFQTTNTGCSLGSCGIEPKLSREVIEERKIEFAREWFLDESGEPGTAKYWYGTDVAKYERMKALALKLIAEIESGGHVVDEDGMLLEAWRRYEREAES
jgi:hypothetical protein